MKKKFKCKGWYSGLRKCCLMMKFFMLFMLLMVLQVNAKVKSQEPLLSVSVTRASLVDVLKMIESRSNYTCLYSHEEVAKVRNLTIELKDVYVREILDVCLIGTKLLYKIVDITIVIQILNEIEQYQERSKAKQVEQVMQRHTGGGADVVMGIKPNDGAHSKQGRQKHVLQQRKDSLQPGG